MNDFYVIYSQASLPTKQMLFSQFITNPQQMLSEAVNSHSVYQGQLKPIKPVRHHNACRRSDEASLECSAKWSYGRGAVSSTESSWGRVLKRLSSKSKTV